MILPMSIEALILRAVLMTDVFSIAFSFSLGFSNLCVVDLLN